MRDSRIALINTCGSTPTWRSSMGSYDTLAPNSVPPFTLTAETPLTALNRGVKTSSAMRCSAPGVYGPLSSTRSSGGSSSSSGTRFPTCGGVAPSGISVRINSSRSRIAKRVICTLAFGSSSISKSETPSREVLLVLRTPRTPCAAASIGDERYISTSSAEAPCHVALTWRRGSSTVVRVASASRVNETAPPKQMATATAQITAGRLTAQRIMPPAPRAPTRVRDGGPATSPTARTRPEAGRRSRSAR